MVVHLRWLALAATDVGWVDQHRLLALAGTDVGWVEQHRLLVLTGGCGGSWAHLEAQQGAHGPHKVGDYPPALRGEQRCGAGCSTTHTAAHPRLMIENQA